MQSIQRNFEGRSCYIRRGWRLCDCGYRRWWMATARWWCSRGRSVCSNIIHCDLMWFVSINAYFIQSIFTYVSCETPLPNLYGFCIYQFVEPRCNKTWLWLAKLGPCWVDWLMAAFRVCTAKVQFETADNTLEIIMADHPHFASNQPTDKRGQPMRESSHQATSKIWQTCSWIHVNSKNNFMYDIQLYDVQ